MKRCPRCEKTFPDTENFCSDDGTALVAASSAQTRRVDAPPIPTADNPPADEERIECPVCGGKAEPGEVICNFCGARLDQTTSQPTPHQSGMFRTQAMGTPPPSAPTGGPRRVEDHTFDDESPLGGEPRSRGILGIIGYIVAALVALGGGIWLALYLSSKPSAVAPVATASPSSTASPAVTAGPTVTLASNLLVQVGGPAATATERSAAAATKVFTANSGTLLDLYKSALAGDSSINDGMVVHLSIDMTGKVTNSSVKVSTTPNPSLDAAVLNAMVGWNFAPSSSGASSVDYPIIFANSPSQIGPIETALSNRIASLNPAEAPEYAFAPGATPTPMATAAVPPPPAVVMPPPTPRPSRHIRSRPYHPPTPSLLVRVQDRLSADPKLRRVKAYTSPGGVVTLYGTVYDEKAKRYAEQVVRSVSGVTSVVDNLTTDTAKWAAEQNRIMAQLQGAGLNGVTVTVIGPYAYLAGTVKSEIDKQRAVTITEGAAPVKVRGNIITVAPGSVF
jgi:TonB family protein